MNRPAVRPLSFASVRLVARPAIYLSEPAWRWQTELRAHFNLWVVLQGRGELACDGARHELLPGSAFVLAPGQRVEARHDPRWPIQNFAAHFLPEANGRTRLRTPEFPLAGIQVAHPGFFGAAARLIVQVAAWGDALAERQAAGLVYQLLCDLWRSRQSPPRPAQDLRIAKLVERVHEQPGQWLSVAQMAREVELSPAHFARRFRAVVGEAPNRWLVQRRIDRARELLCDSPLSVGEVAAALGYNDIYFFSRQFKRVVGASPRAYRQAAARALEPA